MTPTTLHDGFAFIEGPRWHEGALWFSDMHGDVVWRAMPGKPPEKMVDVPGNPSGLGWLPDGRLLVVSMMDKQVLRQEPGGQLVKHADLSGVAARRTNDMVVSATGHAWVGNFGFDFDTGEAPAPAALAGISPEAKVTKAAEGLMFPNGMVITPDGKTLIVAETFGGKLTAFDIARDNTLSNKRDWAVLPEGAVPDGICLDAEGAVWAASPTTGTCLRLKEGGEILATITTGRQTIACALGGTDGKTLYLSTAETTHRDKCRALRSARIETVQVSVPGTPTY
jgi:sugar lactone lactonase YvrE